MPYPVATPEQIRHYQERGWLAVDDALAPADLAHLQGLVRAFVADDDLRRSCMPHGEAIVQAMLALVWIEWQDSAWHRWSHAFCEALVGRPLDFWYDQLLNKPPRIGLATGWHQDQAFMNTDGRDLMISCWLTLDDVGVDGGCMHFEEGGHARGVRRELGVDGSPIEAEKSIDKSRVRAAPLRAGGVTFHGGFTPHMTHTNTTERWRNVVIQRFTIRGMPVPTGH